MLRDVFGPEKAEEISEEIGTFLEQMKTLGWKDMKPWSDFLTLSLSFPSNMKLIEERIVANFLFYRTNYILMICLIFGLRLLFAPILFVGILVCGSVSYCLIVVIKGPLSVGEYEINEIGKITICCILSFFILGLCGVLEHVLWSFVISFGICILHMFCRPRTISSSSNKIYEEFKISTSNWFTTKGSSPASGHRDPDIEDVEASNETDFHSNQGITSGSMRKRKN